MADNMALMLLGIKDYDIEGIEDVFDKGKHHKCISLKYSGEIPTVCPICNNPLYKHGKRSLRVNDTPLQGCPVVLDIEIPRMRCRNAENKHVWSPTLYNVDEKHKMTKRALLALTEHSMRTTFEDASLDFVLSPNTVKNVFVDFLNDNKKNLRFKTPAFIGIDEIKVKKLGELTVITDIEHRTLYDILQGRNQKTLTEYFMELRDRDKVQWVCSDMYRPFEKSISEAMPNAQWAIDHFHVVMKANEAVDAVRCEIQKGMSKPDRIKTKKGLAYTLKTRLKDLDPEDAAKVKAARCSPELAPLAIAFDLKEDFFNIYDENPSSKDNAKEAFFRWEQSIPKDKLYDKFRELAATVHRFETQIFAYWDCPIAISNGYTECTNRLIRENNLRGRGYSFEVLRARTLYRKTNLRAMLENGLIDVGPIIPEDQPVFHFDSTKEDEDDELEDDYEPFPEPEEE
ncbi:ISL3 family transposase [[Clostridium] innocuum]|uniref:ISL3 family transposase n=1 Tax=Clostridium innocuum TaxID=1522 RepID=UPI000D6CD5AE|nr:ISL3 family transposase [[Clostridium] innocuum]PWJ09832.1 transposase [[Clostridium] innocuum]SSA49431.1 Transposase [[Clostridium] innocuum]